MPTRKLLKDYEAHLKEPISGVTHTAFNGARGSQELFVACSCGATFKSKKEVLAARFMRGSNIMCRACVNSSNGKLGGRPKNA